LGIARAFLREGARVAITGRDPERGRSAEAELRADGAARFIEADASVDADVEASIGAAVEFLGRLDVLVNNAGVGVAARVLETPVAEFDRLMAVNLRGYFLYGRAAYPYLAASHGCMIHVSSDAGLRGEQAIGVYSVSKAAVVMLSKMLALDGAADGVRSNCICPGATLPGMRHMGPLEDPERGDDSGDWVAPPLGRLGRPEDIANAAVFLASAEAEFCSGVVLLVDGAMQAGLPDEADSDRREP
jgi:NAD(P)-dependent dehydrogenase (short-subunit alcohol dehydrogenase family)